MSSTPAYITGEYAEAKQGNVTVNATLALTSADATTSQTPQTGEDLTAIVYNYTGTPSVAWTGTDNATIAPAGINVNISGTQVIITGTPTAAGNFGYTVSAAGINGGTDANNLSGTITVSLAPVDAVLTLVSESPNANVNTGETVDIDFDYTGATPVITWMGTAGPNIAPAGITVDMGTDYISIFGAPAVAGPYVYIIEVDGLNGGSNATNGGTINVTAALTVPANIAATPNQTSINLTWDKVEGAEKYIVYLCHDEEQPGGGGGGEGGEPIALTLTSDYTVFGASGKNDETTFETGGITFGFKQLKQEGDVIKFKNNSVHGVIYNTTAIPGKITSVTYTNSAATRACTVYGGTSRLVSNTSGDLAISGNIFSQQDNNAKGNQEINFSSATADCSFFAIKPSIANADSKLSNIIVNYVTSGGESGTIIVSDCDEYETATNGILIENLTPETQYTYQVKAVRGTEETAYSEAGNTTTLKDAVRILKSVTLKWSTVEVTDENIHFASLITDREDKMEVYFELNEGFLNEDYPVYLNGILLGQDVDLQGKPSTYYDFGTGVRSQPWTLEVKDKANNTVETYTLTVANVSTGVNEMENNDYFPAGRQPCGKRR